MKGKPKSERSSIKDCFYSANSLSLNVRESLCLSFVVYAVYSIYFLITFFILILYKGRGVVSFTQFFLKGWSLRFFSLTILPLLLPLFSSFWPRSIIMNIYILNFKNHTSSFDLLFWREPVLLVLSFFCPLIWPQT